MPAVDVSSMTDRLQFGAAVRSRSWEWLFALRKRLNLELQLVDDGLTTLLAAGGKSAEVDSLLSSAPGVRLAVSAAIRTRTPQAANVDRLQTVVVGDPSVSEKIRDLGFGDFIERSHDPTIPRA